MKKILSLVLALSLLVSMCVFTSVSVSAEGEQWDGEAAADFSGGDGSKDKPYQIGTAGELKLFADKVNAGETGICGILTADIVLNTGTFTTDDDGNLLYDGAAVDENTINVWFPIGYWKESKAAPYSGTFNGNNHTVSGLYFNNTNQNYVGLFGWTGPGAEISSLGVVNSYIKGSSRVGGVCGSNGGTITGCYNTGMVSGNDSIGGVCGWNYKIITGCYNTGTISGSTNVGGVCGWNQNPIIGCYNTGAVSGNSNVGGVSGYSEIDTITACYNTGMVSGNNYIGGVCGLNYKIITNCYYLTGTASDGIGYNGGTGSAEPKTEEYMKSQDFVDLLNQSEGVSFAFNEGGFPVQSRQIPPAPEYTVTIPAEVALGQPCPVSVDVTVLPTGKQVAVTLTGTSGAANAFTMQTADGASLTYTVSNGANSVSMGEKILAANAVGNAETSLVFNAPETVQFAGTYTGTVTFTVSVADAD